MLVNHKRWFYAPHLRILNDYLLRVVSGEIKRLIVTMPPRHGKSEMISRAFPFWLLGNYPWIKIMLASYSAGFASSWQRKVGGLIRAYGPPIFGTRTARVKHGLGGLEVEAFDRDDNRWLYLDGGMMTAGTQTSMTGRGADVMIIDDPIKNAQEANSPVYRQRTWEWFQSTAYTRLEKDASIILVMTRWHQDDIAGRLIDLGRDEEANLPWYVLRLPAFGDEDPSADPMMPDLMTLHGYRNPGDALWPEMFNDQALRQIRSVLGSYWFTAMYQGVPSPRSGGFFDRMNFNIIPIEQAPVFTQIAHKSTRYWDLAMTESRYTSGGDWTSGLLLAHHDGEWWIYHVDRFQGSPEQVYRRIEQRAAQDGRRVRITVEQEPGASGKGVISDIRNRKALKGFTVRADRPTGDKQLRATLPSAQSEAGLVNIVSTGDPIADRWIETFLHEVEIFPHGSNDDQVDTLSGAMRTLERQLRLNIGLPLSLAQRSRWKL